MESVQSTDKEGSQRDLTEKFSGEQTPNRAKAMLNEYDESPIEVLKKTNSKQIDSRTLSRLSPIDQPSFEDEVSMSEFSTYGVNQNETAIHKATQDFRDAMFDLQGPKALEELLRKKTRERLSFDIKHDLTKCVHLFKHYMSENGWSFNDSYFPASSSSLVNNFRKCSLPWKSNAWERLYNIYPNATVCKNFEASELVYFGGPLYNFCTVCVNLCAYPKIVQEMFIDPENCNTPAGVYVCQLQCRGNCRQIIVDDNVPITTTFPLFLKPGVEDRMSSKIDLWPQIICKALAKMYVNYERIQKQSVPLLLRDMTRRPVRSIKAKDLEWEMLRTCYTRNYLVIIEADYKFTTTHCKGMHSYTLYLTLVHAFEAPNSKLQLLEQKSFSHIVNKKEQFNVGTQLKIDNDWKAHRTYTKHDESTFWIAQDEIKDCFKKVHICMLEPEENMNAHHHSFRLGKDQQLHTVYISVEKEGPAIFEIQQLDKILNEQDYQYSNLRIFLCKKSDEPPYHDLQKAIYTNESRDSLLETVQKPGEYVLMIQGDLKKDDSRDYMLNIHYSKASKLAAEEDLNVKNTKAFNDMLCNICIQKGDRDKLTSDGEVSRYKFYSKRLGLQIFAYTNPTEYKLNIIDQLSPESRPYFCKKEIKDNNFMKLTLNPRSKKAINFRFPWGSDAQLSVVDHVMGVSEN